jgi:5'-nucleotidase
LPLVARGYVIGMTADPRPLVLVTNDDGLGSDGLRAAAMAIEAIGARALVAAPSSNMSGAGAAIGPIGSSVGIRRVQLDEIEGDSFAVDAPPAMIVVSALSGAFGEVPTAVISGVNAGVNLGRAILHSGTVGAAMTAQNLGLPAVAISLSANVVLDDAHGGDVHSSTTWRDAADAGVRVLDSIMATGRPLLANVNAPASVVATTEVVRTRLARFGSVTAALTDDALQFQLVIDAGALDEEGTDAAAVHAGQISVSFLGGVNGEEQTDVDLSLRRVAAQPATADL